MSTVDRLALSLTAHSGTVSVEPCYGNGFPPATELAPAVGLRRDARQKAKHRSRLFGVRIISRALQSWRWLKQHRPIEQFVHHSNDRPKEGSAAPPPMEHFR